MWLELFSLCNSYPGLSSLRYACVCILRKYFIDPTFMFLNPFCLMYLRPFQLPLDALLICSF